MQLRYLQIAVLGGLLLATWVLPASAQDTGSERIYSQEAECRRLYQEGLEYMKNQRLNDAAEAFDTVRETCPAMVDAYLNLGIIYVQLNRYSEAIAVYEAALDQDPDNLDIKEAMAFALSSAGELDDALDLYLELHESNPENLKVMRNLAFVYQQQGMIAESVMLYNRLIELGEADVRMLSEAGRMSLEEKLFLPAVTFYQKLYEYNPKDVNTLGILGGYYYKIRFYEEARGYYEKILEIEPDHANALLYHKILGHCCKSIKDHACAAEHAEYVLEREPNDLNNYCSLAFIYKDASDIGSALSTIERGLAQFPEGDCLWYAWGTTLEKKGRMAEEKKRFQEAIDAYEEAKGKFQHILSLPAGRYTQYATQQLERMDALIERVYKLIEQEEMRSGQ